jgi:hypothetical protein
VNLVTIPKRSLTPVAGEDICAQAFSLATSLFNHLVVLDRRGDLGDGAKIKRALGWVVSTNFLGREWLVFVQRIVREYRNRRAKADGPLRFKNPTRMSTVPLAGPLEALRPAGAVNARLRRVGVGYAVCATSLAEILVPDHAERLARVYHHSKVEDIGMAATANGLDLLVINHRRDDRGTVESYHIDLKTLIKPGFVQDLYRHMIAPKANTVALDVSMLPASSGRVRAAIWQLHRLLRARKAVGAVEYRKVSPVREEIQDRIALAKAGHQDKSLVRSIRRNLVLKCPHCGAPVGVRLDEKSQVPKALWSNAKVCRSCGIGLSVGDLLAARASFQANYAFFEHVARGKDRPDRLESDRPTTAPYGNNTNARSTTQRCSGRTCHRAAPGDPVHVTPRRCREAKGMAPKTLADRTGASGHETAPQTTTIALRRDSSHPTGS